jgi:hypothetical protein
MDARATPLRRRHSGWRVGVEAAVAAEANQDGNREFFHSSSQLGGVVARIEDEQRRWTLGRDAAEQVGDLFHGDNVGVLAWMDAPHIEWGSPAVLREAELGQPLVRPAGHDRLPGGVAGGVIVKAPLRAGLGVTARPDAQVNSVDCGTIAGSLPRQQPLQGRHVEGPFGQGIVEAAPATAVCRLHAEVGQRSHRLGCQQGINELEQGIAATTEAAVQGGAKGAQGLEVMSGHAAQPARTPRRWPPRPSTAPPRVKSQAKERAMSRYQLYALK